MRCLIAVLAVLAGVVPASTLRLEDSTRAMGTTYTIVVYGPEMSRMRRAINSGFGEIRRVDRMLSNYRSESEVSEVNRNAAVRPVKVTHEFFALVSDCLRYSRQSGGTFDITVGPLMTLWGFFRGTGHLVGKREVAEALQKVGYSKVVLNAAQRTVRFTHPDVEFDFGGIGKGYAVDRVVTILRENSVTAALLNAGSSSIYALGAPTDRRTRLGNQHSDPSDRSKVVEKLFLKNESISTSGSSEKFFIAEGRTYAHIMDPRSGYPAEGMLEVSVIAPRTLDSEAWTKPYFILGRDWAAKHKPKAFRVFLCPANGPCQWLP